MRNASLPGPDQLPWNMADNNHMDNHLDKLAKTLEEQKQKKMVADAKANKELE